VLNGPKDLSAQNVLSALKGLIALKELNALKDRKGPKERIATALPDPKNQSLSQMTPVNARKDPGKPEMAPRNIAETVISITDNVMIVAEIRTIIAIARTGMTPTTQTLSKKAMSKSSNIRSVSNHVTTKNHARY
jgi:hypothetical protein